MPFIRQLKGLILPSRYNLDYSFWVKIPVVKPYFLFYKIFYLCPQTFPIVEESVKSAIYFICTTILQTSQSLFQIQGTCRAHRHFEIKP